VKKVRTPVVSDIRGCCSHFREMLRVNGLELTDGEITGSCKILSGSGFWRRSRLDGAVS